MTDTIIRGFDVWSDAQGVKSRGRVRSIDNISLQGIARLRELILELAVSGKLVRQEASDEPAAVLLKKSQNGRDISKPQKAPTKIPIGWKIARLRDVATLEMGQSPAGNSYNEEGNGVPLINGPVEFGAGPFDKTVRTKFTTSPTKMCKEGDLLVCVRGATTGRTNIAGFDACIGRGVASLTPRFYPRYLHYFMLRSRYVLLNLGTGTTFPSVSKEEIQNVQFLLPPLAEQHRIVAKVDELMALCDKLEASQTASLKTHQTLVKALLQTLTDAADADSLATAWQRLSPHFDVLFCTEDSIEQLKQTILQLAIMGRLVKQDHTDEPASELIKRIETEKAKMIKEGKLKKEKALPQITQEEKPFGLPEGWMWKRLGAFTLVGTGSTPSRDNSNYYDPPEINWVSSGETSQEFIYATNEKISLRALKETNVSVYPKGSLIIAMYGQGKTRGQVSELMIDAGTNQACAAIEPINKSECHRRYLKYFFKKAYEEIRSNAAGGAQPNLNLGKVANTIIPLPPLGEQDRIVAKVDELISFCDRLKAKILKAEEVKVQLSKTIVEAAVA